MFMVISIDGKSQLDDEEESKGCEAVVVDRYGN
jgi:hypothetical protein